MTRAERWQTDLARLGFRGATTPDRPLAPLTTWRIGGPAELLVHPHDADDLVTVVRYCREQSIERRVLGNGSNLLIRDAGVRGIVIHLRRCLDRFEVDGTRLITGAGAFFPAVARLAARNGLSGLEFAAGIPGTIGGAIVMNAGWHEFELGNTVTDVDVLACDGERETLPHAACEFAYRSSALRKASSIVLEARLALQPEDPAEITARLEHFAASRKANQPTELPSCGSVFVQPPGDFAGRLIEQAGLKGHRVGVVEVSPKHANFFVNLGDGTAEQVLELVTFVESRVEEQFGVRLEREFEVW